MLFITLGAVLVLLQMAIATIADLRNIEMSVESISIGIVGLALMVSGWSQEIIRAINKAK